MDEPEYHVPSDELIELFNLGNKASLQPPRFAKVTASDASTVTVTLGGEDVEAVRCCICAAGDVVLLETLPSGRLAAVGTRGATSTTYTAGANIQISAANVISATDTTYTAGTGLTLSGTTINHSNAVTAGTIGSTSATSGATLAVPYATYDAQGHITAKGTHTHTVNGIDLTSAVTGTLPIANGGTGATTALAAWQNLQLVATAGTDASTYVGWYKVATGTFIAYSDNCDLTFYVHRSIYGSPIESGLLHLCLRNNGDGNTAVSAFYWEHLTAINPGHYIVTVSGNTWNLYVYNSSRWYRIFLHLIDTSTYWSDGGTAWSDTMSMTLYQQTTLESTTPSGTVSTFGFIAGNTSCYCYTSTAAATAAKVATVQGSDPFRLARHSRVAMRVLTNNTVTTGMTINVGGSGAMSTVYKGNVGYAPTWSTNQVLDMVYDGQYWVIVSLY